MCGFEKFKERLPSKENYSFNKEDEHVLKVWHRLEMKTINIITTCT